MTPNFRNDMYLVSEALRLMKKSGNPKLTAADWAVLDNYKKHVDGVTKFIPTWVKVAVAMALGLGTMVGWKRIVVTVGEKIGKQHLTYAQGAAAEITAMVTIGAADYMGLPVSTTHVLSSGVAGTMAANHSGLQWGTVRALAMAWVLTLPASIVLAAGLFAAVPPASYMSVGLDALSPAGTHWGDNRAALVLVSLVAIWIALGTNLVGMRVGKWTENLGASASWTLAAMLVLVAALAWSRHGSATPLQLIPHWSWGTVNFWSTIAYAMTGLELAGMVSGEIHDPERTLPRAGWIASGFVTLFYVAATASVLVLLNPGQISELTGLAQAGAAAATVTGLAWLAPLVAVLVMASAVGQFGGLGSAVSRLPFAAGVDCLLPAALARVHTRWQTPHIAILIFGGLASFLLVAIQLGDTVRAAYQELVSLTVIAGFLPFVYIFASLWKAGRRWSAASGGAVTLIALVCAVVPTDQISDVWLFEAKLWGGTAVIVLAGWLLYRRGARSVR
jgi:amino acid transporter